MCIYIIIIMYTYTYVERERDALRCCPYVCAKTRGVGPRRTRGVRQHHFDSMSSTRGENQRGVVYIREFKDVVFEDVVFHKEREREKDISGVTEPGRSKTVCKPKLRKMKYGQCSPASVNYCLGWVLLGSGLVTLEYMYV